MCCNLNNYSPNLKGGANLFCLFHGISIFSLICAVSVHVCVHMCLCMGGHFIMSKSTKIFHSSLSKDWSHNNLTPLSPPELPPETWIENIDLAGQSYWWPCSALKFIYGGLCLLRFWVYPFVTFWPKKKRWRSYDKGLQYTFFKHWRVKSYIPKGIII